MPRYYDVNVNVIWEEGQPTPRDARLSAILIGPNIQVFEDEPVDGSYSADPNGTGDWVTFPLPGWDGSVHEPVNVDYWNEVAGFTWMTELKNVVIKDEDGTEWTIPEDQWEIDTATGVLRLKDNILIDLNVDFIGKATGVWTTQYDGEQGVVFKVESPEQGFPYVDGVKLKVGDYVVPPYTKVANSDYTATPTTTKILKPVNPSTSTVSINNITGNTIELNASVNSTWDGHRVMAEAIIHLSGGDYIVIIVGDLEDNGVDTFKINNAKVAVPGQVNGSISISDIRTALGSAVIHYMEPLPDVTTSAIDYNGLSLDATGTAGAPMVALTARFYDISSDQSVSSFEEGIMVFYPLDDPSGSSYSYSSVVYSTAQDSLGDDYVAFLFYVPKLFIDGSLKKLYAYCLGEQPFGSTDTTFNGVRYAQLELSPILGPNPGMFEAYILQYIQKFAGLDSPSYTVGLLWSSDQTIDNSTLTGDVRELTEAAVIAANPSGITSMPVIGAIYPVSKSVFYQENTSDTYKVIEVSGDYVQLFKATTDSSAVTNLPVNPPFYMAPWQVSRYISGTPLVTYMVFNKDVPDEPYKLVDLSDITDYLGKTTYHPYAILARAAYIGFLNRTDRNNSVSFFVFPIGAQNDQAWSDAVEKLRQLADQLSAPGEMPPVYYDIAPLTMKEDHVTLFVSFAEDRSRLVWSDPRHIWAALPLPPFNEVKVNLGEFASLNNGVLYDPDINFVEVGVEAGDFVQVLPPGYEYGSTDFSVTVKSGSVRAVIDIPNLATNLTGYHFVLKSLSLNEVLTGVVESQSETKLIVKFDQPPDFDATIDGSNGQLNFFSNWVEARVVEVNSNSITLSQQISGGVENYYRIYSHYTADEMVEIWTSKAQQFNSMRLSLVNPKVQLVYDDATWTVPGFYLAAAKAVQASAKLNISEPTSHWPTRGFTHVFYGNDSFDKIQLARLAAGGVSVHIDMFTNGPVTADRDVTTYTATENDPRHLYPVVKVVDYIVHSITRTLELYTAKYAFNADVRTKISNSIHVLINKWKSRRNPDKAIVNNAVLKTIKLIRTPEDLPSDYQWPQEIPFETGVYLELDIEYRTIINRIPVTLYVKKPSNT